MPIPFFRVNFKDEKWDFLECEITLKIEKHFLDAH